MTPFLFITGTILVAITSPSMFASIYMYITIYYVLASLSSNFVHHDLSVQFTALRLNSLILLHICLLWERLQYSIIPYPPFLPCTNFSYELSLGYVMYDSSLGHV